MVLFQINAMIVNNHSWNLQKEQAEQAEQSELIIITQQKIDSVEKENALYESAFRSHQI